MNTIEKLTTMAQILLSEKEEVSTVDVSSAIIDLCGIIGVDAFSDDAIEARSLVISKMVRV